MYLCNLRTTVVYKPLQYETFSRLSIVKVNIYVELQLFFIIHNYVFSMSKVVNKVNIVELYVEEVSRFV